MMSRNLERLKTIEQHYGETRIKTDLKLEEWVVSSRCDVGWRNGTVEGVAAHLWAYGIGPKKTCQAREKHNIQVS